MSLIYIFRHGQAGSRDDYDRLSRLGREQAELLGRHFADEEMKFDAFFTGPLKRQVETAQIVHHKCGGPAPQVDAHWAEFDLDAVAAAIAPFLAAEDPGFAQAYAEAAQAHRHWTPADAQIVRAWIEERFETQIESWSQFNERVAAARETLAEFPRDARIAISTSATPMSIWMSLALDLTPDRIMHLAGSAHNSSYSVFRLRGTEVDLLAYNAIPHLTSAQLRTLK
jgi:broad specificity phosphatase PhoE